MAMHDVIQHLPGIFPFIAIIGIAWAIMRS